MTSSEDLEDDGFETTPASIISPTSFDPTLENKGQAIIEQHKCSRSVASTTTNVSEDEAPTNSFKMGI